MISTIKLLTITLALIDVRVSTLSENNIDGKLIRIDEKSVVVAKDGRQASVGLTDVIEVAINRAPDENPPPEPDQQLMLGDGSILNVTDVMSTAETVQGASENLGSISVPRKGVRSIRLQPMQDEWKAEWDAFLKRSNTKDMVIVPKSDRSGLDFLPGVVTAIGAEEIPFLLDGDAIPVPRAKVFGIVFAAVDRKQNGLAGDTMVSFVGGTSIRATSVRVDGEELQTESSWGQSLNSLVDHVSIIDFSGGRIHHLSDLEPLTELYFGLDPPGKGWGQLFEKDESTRTGMSRQWKMSRDSFPNSGRPPLTLRSQTYAKGLCVFPSAKIEYALDGRYSSLKALVGVDDEVAFNQLKGKPPTVVELRLEADGKEVYRQLIQAPEDPVDLDIKLTGVTTLTVIVDFGDGASTCDYLDIVNPRLFVNTSVK